MSTLRLRNFCTSQVAACLLTAAAAAPAAAADGDALNSFVLFGVRGETADLVCFDFSKDEYQVVGTVRDGSGQALTGIEGMAYVPRHHNLFGFWSDSDDGDTRLVYINCHDAKATFVGQGLGNGSVTGATVAYWDHDRGHGNDADGTDEDNTGSSEGVNENGMGHGAHSGVSYGPGDPTPLGVVSQLRLFAVQSVEAEEDEEIDFDIVDGTIVSNEPFAAKVSVLGAAISYGGQYDIPVTTQFKVSDQTFTPFGSPSLPVNGNVNDNHNPRHFIVPDVFPAGTPVTIFGKSWVKKKSWYQGNKNWHWNGYLSADSATNTPQVKVLRNGDPVPDITPFLNQSAIVDLVIDYIDQDTDTIKLDENQAIFLFELGTTNLGSSAADFQDLVVLVTLATNVESLEEADDDDAEAGPSARLVRVDPKTGGFEQLMTLDRAYDGLAADGSGCFWATSEGQLWKLEPQTQKETALGPLAYGQVKGLEFAGSMLEGFGVVNDRLAQFDVLGDGVLGNSLNIDAVDLTSIVFARQADLPSTHTMD